MCERDYIRKLRIWKGKINMKNTIKVAAAVALGVSTIGATGIGASAATTFKVNAKGKLVTKKGTVVKGYKKYKNVLYKDGKKYTGTRSGQYYKAGKLATGDYNNVFYSKGIAYTGIAKSSVKYKGLYLIKGKKGTGDYKKFYYVAGKKYTGIAKKSKLYKNQYVKNGKPGTGIVAKKQYVKGKLVSGKYGKHVYVSGVKVQGLHKGVFYKNGLVATGVASDNLYYVKGNLATGEYKGAIYTNGVVTTSKEDLTLQKAHALLKADLLASQTAAQEAKAQVTELTLLEAQLKGEVIATKAKLAFQPLATTDEIKAFIAELKGKDIATLTAEEKAAYLTKLAAHKQEAIANLQTAVNKVATSVIALTQQVQTSSAAGANAEELKVIVEESTKALEEAKAIIADVAGIVLDLSEVEEAVKGAQDVTGVKPEPTEPTNPTPTEPENPTPTEPTNPTPTEPENPTGGGSTGGGNTTQTVEVKNVEVTNVDGKITVNAAVANTTAGTTAKVEILDSKGEAVETIEAVEITEGKISKVVDGLSAGTYTAKVTVGAVSATSAAFEVKAPAESETPGADALAAAIEAAKALTPADYTENSYAAVKGAVEAAEALTAEATDEAKATAATVILEAIKALEKTPAKALADAQTLLDGQTIKVPYGKFDSSEEVLKALKALDPSNTVLAALTVESIDIDQVAGVVVTLKAESTEGATDAVTVKVFVEEEAASTEAKVIADTDAKYTVEGTTITVPFGEEVKVSDLTVSEGAEFVVKADEADAEAKANDAVLENGDKVTVTAQDGTTIETYTVVVSEDPNAGNTESTPEAEVAKAKTAIGDSLEISSTATEEAVAVKDAANAKLAGKDIKASVTAAVKSTEPELFNENAEASYVLTITSTENSEITDTVKVTVKLKDAGETVDTTAPTVTSATYKVDNNEKTATLENNVLKFQVDQGTKTSEIKLQLSEEVTLPEGTKIIVKDSAGNELDKNYGEIKVEGKNIIIRPTNGEAPIAGTFKVEVQLPTNQKITDAAGNELTMPTIELEVVDIVAKQAQAQAQAQAGKLKEVDLGEDGTQLTITFENEYDVQNIYNVEQFLNDNLQFQVTKIYRTTDGIVKMSSDEAKEKDLSEAVNLTATEVKDALYQYSGNAVIDWTKVQLTQKEDDKKVIVVTVSENLISATDLTASGKINSTIATTAGYKISFAKKGAAVSTHKLVLTATSNLDTVTTTFIKK